MTLTPILGSGRRAALAGGVAAAAFAMAGGAYGLPVAAPGPYAVSAGGAQPVIASSGSTVRVDLNAPRTIIDWQSFNLGAGERADFLFDQRNWIVLNRVNNAAIAIDGQVFGGQAANLNSPAPGTSGGNVWFYSPQGVAFGGTARVDVGGLLATSAAVNTAAFLTPATLNIPFTGAGNGGPVTVAGGARFTGTGHLAFIAPSVSTGASANVDAGDYGTAAYAAADSYELQFTPTFNNDLTFFTFIVPSAAAGTPLATPLQISGSTKGANVYLVAMSRAALTGLLINAPGLLTGQSSFVEYGQVTISTGRNIVSGQVGAGSEAQQVAGVTTGSVRLGEINAGGNSNIYLTGTGSLGDLTADKIRAGQSMIIAAQNITIGAGGLTVGDSSDGRVGARRSLLIDSAGVVTIPQLNVGGGLTITRGAAQTGRTTQASTLRLGTVTSGGNMLMNGAGAIDAGAVTAGGEAQLFGGLPVRLTSLTTNGYTRISSSQNIVVGAVRGVDLDLRSATGIQAASLTGTTSVAVGTGGSARIGSITGPNLTLDALGASLDTVTVAGDVRLRVGSWGLNNSLTAANLTIEAAGGNYTLGGNAIGALTDAEFQRIRLTGALSIYGGLTAPTVNVPAPVYGDLDVQSVTLDPTKIPTLNLYANRDHEVRIFGPVDTVGVGAGLVRIGDPAPDSPWAPKTIKIMDPSNPIDIVASLGAPELRNARALELYAAGDILIGSRRFVDLVSATPPDQLDLARGLPAGVAPTPDEVNLLYILGGRLTMAAGGRILSQNTSAAGQEVGIVLTGLGVPAGEPVLTLGRAQKVEVFVSFVSNGILTSGQQVALSDRIGRLAGDTSLSSIRINGCVLGVGCALATPATQFRIEQFQPAEASVTAAGVDPPVLTPPPPVDEEDREAEAVVTGTGNEEIWRSPK